MRDKNGVSERPSAEVQSVARAARILLAFLDATTLGPTEVAQRTGLHRSVAHRLLSTLASSGLLLRDRRTGTYRLGPVMGRLQPSGGMHAALRQAAQPYLESLAEHTGETISLCVVDGAKGLCIAVSESRQAMRFTVKEGETFALHAGCIGKVLLAWQHDAVLDTVLGAPSLHRYTENTITDPDRLRAELARIRELGYGFSDSEITPQSRSVGAPVFGPDGQVVASLAVSAPAYRMPDESVPALSRQVMDEARRMSRDLGHHPSEPAPPGRFNADKESSHAVQ